MDLSKKNWNAEQMKKEMGEALLSWYDFHRPGDILYLSENAQGPPDFLAETGRTVVCVTPSEAASEAFGRTWEKGFAYLIAVEVLEGQEQPAEALKVWKRLLCPEGCLLLGMNNRLGLRYFCGDPDPYSKNSFDGIEGRGQTDQASGRLYARAEIQGLLLEGGFGNGRYYSVFPGLRLPQMLFWEGYTPKEELGVRLFPLYHNPDVVFLEEERLYTSLIENGMFHPMANAFLIECPLDGRYSDAQQVSLSADRGRDNGMATIIRERTVEKRALYSQGRERLRRLCRNMEELKERGIPVVPGELRGDRYVMPRIEGEIGIRLFRRLYRRDLRAFMEKLDGFWNLILRSSDTCRKAVTISGLLGDGKKRLGDDGREQDGLGEEICLRHGFIDLVPLNCFYVDGEFCFFDQEFREEDLPAKAVMIRVIDLILEGGSGPERAFKEELLKRYGLKEHAQVWREKSHAFTYALRNEAALRPLLDPFRRDLRRVRANRIRAGVPAEEYRRCFLDIFQGLGGRQLFLFGSGIFARHFMACYGKGLRIEGILDNSRERWGKALEGIPILAPSRLKGLDPETYKVIVCVQDCLGIVRQLKDMGVKYYGVYDKNMDYPTEGILGRGSPPAWEWEAKAAREAKAGGKKYHTGYVAGVFDLFHIGHLNLLRRAKEQCDYLIVGVVTDEGVRRNKKTNPFIPFEERLEVVRACRYVDWAVEIPLEYPSTRDAYAFYHFDVQFSGGDYELDPDWLEQKRFLEKQGAELVFFPYTEQTSSTKLKGLIDRSLSETAGGKDSGI